MSEFTLIKRPLIWSQTLNLIQLSVDCVNAKGISVEITPFSLKLRGKTLHNTSMETELRLYLSVDTKKSRFNINKTLNRIEFLLTKTQRKIWFKLLFESTRDDMPLDETFGDLTLNGVKQPILSGN